MGVQGYLAIDPDGETFVSLDGQVYIRLYNENVWIPDDKVNVEEFKDWCKEKLRFRWIEYTLITKES